MKIKTFSQKLKSSVRRHYVRKKDFEALTKEVHRLTKKLAKLEKCCESSTPIKETNPETKKKKIAKKPAPIAKAPQASSTPQDKLTRIRGIGPVLEKKLHGLGVFHFSQIAGWSQDDIDRIAEHLSFKGRIEREEWVKQAKELT